MIAIQTAFPVVTTTALARVKQFYETLFGFNTVFFDTEFYLHMVSADGNIQLGFLMPDLESQPEFLRKAMVPEGYVISFEVKDATAAFEQAQQLNLTIAMSLKHEVWGQVHFMVTDPAGVNIDIVQHLDAAQA
ncbi:VOC family protein [Aliikangiella maris]|uniref:VOC family protein n=2 Tax=Aliikangiella maris TaxID=3162458 RepID=A0ABV2BW69_9GAMM